MPRYEDPLPDSVGTGGACPTVFTPIDPYTRIRVWLRGQADTVGIVTADLRQSSTSVTLAVCGDAALTTETTEATAYPYAYAIGGRRELLLDGRVFQSFKGDGTSGLSYAVEPL